MEQIIQFKTSDGETVDVPSEIMSISGLISAIIDYDDDSDYVKKIPLKNVKRKILDRVVEFCSEYHNDSDKNKEKINNIQKPIRTNKLSDFIPPWYVTFIDINHDDVFDIIMAANYLDIKLLLDVSCLKIATMLKGKNDNEIREAFNIKDKFENRMEVDNS